MTNSAQGKMDWNDAIKKEARGTDDIDLGESTRGRRYLCSHKERSDKQTRLLFTQISSRRV